MGLAKAHLSKYMMTFYIIIIITSSQVEELSLQANNDGENNNRRFGWKKFFRSNKIIDVPVKSEEVERRQHAFEDL